MELNVVFKQEDNQSFDLHFDQIGNGSNFFDANFGQIQQVTEYVDRDPYEGNYSIVPKVSEQTMFTKDKVMLDNVTVEAIPYAEVTNNSNGYTVTIG